MQKKSCLSRLFTDTLVYSKDRLYRHLTKKKERSKVERVSSHNYKTSENYKT